MSVQPFEIKIEDAVLADLKERLARTRWPQVESEAGWNYGIESGYLKELVDHWQNGYDWRKQEAALNRFAQFRAEIDGMGIHFIHEKGKGPNPTPIILIHGFPDSFYRYHKVIERLTDPAKFGGDPNNSFDVVVPSIPAFGFSDAVNLPIPQIADLFARLMRDELGYSKFVSAGGDFGAVLTMALGRQYPELLQGIYLTDVGYPDQTTDFAALSPAEQQMAAWVQDWFMREGLGVNMVMATKPLTLAYGLNDSPTGLAAWLVSYSSSGGKGREEFKTRFSADEVLTNVTIYWATQTIYSAAKGYNVSSQAAPGSLYAKVEGVPAAVGHAPYDPPLPREWAARHVDLVHFTDFPRGGHFMAWEEPELYANDISDFVAQLRNQPNQS